MMRVRLVTLLSMFFIGLAWPAWAVREHVCVNAPSTMAPTCEVFESHCANFLEKPESLETDDLKRIPNQAERQFRGEKLTTNYFGYKATKYPNVSVVYGLDEPACVILFSGLRYFTVASTYHAWRDLEGSHFAAASDFEPQVLRRKNRAYAAVFLAKEMAEDRVLEMTLNWNLREEGLTLLKFSVQPWRDHTRNMLDKEDK